MAEPLHVDDGLWAVLDPLQTFAWLRDFRRLELRGVVSSCSGSARRDVSEHQHLCSRDRTSRRTF